MIDLVGFRSLIHLFCVFLLKCPLPLSFGWSEYFFYLSALVICWISRCTPLWFVCFFSNGFGDCSAQCLGANIAERTPDVEPSNVTGPLSAVVVCLTATYSKIPTMECYHCCFTQTYGFWRNEEESTLVCVFSYVSFLFFPDDRVSSWYHFPSARRISCLACPVIQVCWWGFLLIFFYVKIYLRTLILESWFDVLQMCWQAFFQLFVHVVPLSSGIHSFWWEVIRLDVSFPGWLWPRGYL